MVYDFLRYENCFNRGKIGQELLKENIDKY